MYAVFEVKQGIFGANGVRQDCYSFPQRPLASALRDVVLRDVSKHDRCHKHEIRRVLGLGTYIQTTQLLPS